MSENNLTPYVIESTGVSVFIRPIPPMLLRAVDKGIPMPDIPMETIEAPDGTTYQERNRNHPAYVEALAERSRRVSEGIADLVIERGVVFELTDAQRGEVEELRTFMRESMGVELEANTRTVYLKHIAIAMPQDLRDLIQSVSGRSVPTNPKLPSG